MIKRVQEIHYNSFRDHRVDFLLLINIAGVMQSTTVPNSSSNLQNIHTIDPALKNVYEKEIQTQEEVLRINPLDSEAQNYNQSLPDLRY